VIPPPVVPELGTVSQDAAARASWDFLLGAVTVPVVTRECPGKVKVRSSPEFGCYLPYVGDEN
jgi:hypothetical protein